MKRKLFILSLFILIGICVPVRAKDYELNTLIPLDEVATVHTEKFDYIDFSIGSELNEKSYRVIQFKSIYNHMITPVPVSINILLFDVDEINIGYLTYCSDKDFDSNYSAYKLQGGASSSFSIRVTSLYLDAKKVPEDVFYIAVADENKYCHTGGYTQYVGQTIEQILGIEKKPADDNPFLESFLSFLQGRTFFIIMVAVIAIIVIIGFGFLLSSLYQKMYTHSSIFAFIPVVDVYVTVKLVFGNIIALIYGVLCIIAGVLYYFGISFLLYIVIALWILSIILVIVKLITKKYDLFYFEPAIDSSKYHTAVDNNFSREEDTLLDEESVYVSAGSSSTPSSSTGMDDILKSLEDSDGTDDDLSKFY